MRFVTSFKKKPPVTVPRRFRNDYARDLSDSKSFKSWYSSFNETGSVDGILKARITNALEIVDYGDV